MLYYIIMIASREIFEKGLLPKKIEDLSALHNRVLHNTR